MRSAPPWALLFVLASVNVVAAQDEAPRVFVDAGGFFSFEQIAHSNIVGPFDSDQDASGTTGGPGVAVGTFLGPRVSLRLETAFPGSVDSSYQIGSGFTFSSIDGLIQPTSTRVEQETRSWGTAVLVGYHTSRRGSVRLGFLGGVAFVRERQESSFEQTVPGFVPLLPVRMVRTSMTLTSYEPAAAVGLDADIAVAPHFAVVPQMRVQAMTGWISLRPGVAVRWTP
jgi:hypothetical protein